MERQIRVVRPIFDVGEEVSDEGSPLILDVIADAREGVYKRLRNGEFLSLIFAAMFGNR